MCVFCIYTQTEDIWLQSTKPGGSPLQARGVCTKTGKDVMIMGVYPLELTGWVEGRGRNKELF